MHKEEFQLEVSNRFNALEENKPAIETFHKIMEEGAERFGQNAKDKPNEKLEEDIEIERLDEKRKSLKKKEGKTTVEKIEYTELNKLVKKERRARQRKKRKEESEKIIANGRGPREAYKGGARKKISCMIKEHGESTTNRHEIITICQTFYRKLYEQKTPDQTNDPNIKS
ncbi:hypothetical protein PoB_001940300 [Plakobranchus ocellatus]|uniref:Uncharacterized protein n=1 Tax=Plakobranchus ocellatus TaxID=259542 RepID=A0AAV3ZDT1_9GAST|nr:hypothetical protein PoB_001940300 [Plakobranchus ocellatus]